MGLTNQSTGAAVLGETLCIENRENLRVIALAGNPNVGKSTVFNALTGLNQHTGNWPGKTVANAQGLCRHKGKDYILVDLPGTYSLLASSVEEEVARDFLCFGGADATVVVVDATCLERNLNLVLQTLEITQRVVVCLNLMDEAEKKGIQVDLEELSLQLGVPVVATSARSGKGLGELMDQVEAVAFGEKKTYRVKVDYGPQLEEAISRLEPAASKSQDAIDSRWLALRLLDGEEKLLDAVQSHLGFDLQEDPGVKKALEEAKECLGGGNIGQEELIDRITRSLVRRAETISRLSLREEKPGYSPRDRAIDRFLTSKATGIPVMLLLLGVVFYLTIAGANLPSQWLSSLFGWLEGAVSTWLLGIGTPAWLHSLLTEGILRTVGWVVSVMLPPMAIFFPMFTLLEDSGYLPRIAFNLDCCFQKAGAHGKQVLTTCMGFGCNACGVIGCRIIESPRERLVAILTNNFVPCNGRFPTLIAIITMFFAGSGRLHSLWSALFLVGLIILSVFLTLIISKILSKTVLKGMPSSFVLEMPPYRRPQIGQVIIRSVFDRTLFVLGRAVAVALPAGVVIWLMANLTLGGESILAICAGFLDPFARLIGLDGVILIAFLLGFPANEIVIPIIIMAYLSTGSLLELGDLTQLHSLLTGHGWTWLTALCTMLFSLMHFPCGTTCWTIRKETGSWKWTAAAVLLPTLTGIVVCFAVASGARFLGLV